MSAIVLGCLTQVTGKEAHAGIRLNRDLLDDDPTICLSTFHLST